MSTFVKEETFETLEKYRKNPSFGLNWSSVFVFPGFMESWWRVFHSENEHLFMRSVWQDDRIIGIAPLKIDGDTASFIGHKDVFDYIDLIIVPGSEKDFFNSLLNHCTNFGIRNFDLGPIRPDATVLTHLAPLVTERGINIESSQEDVFIELPLPATWDDYLESLGGKERHEMRRKIRRLQMAGRTRFQIAGDSETIAGVEEPFFRLFPLSRGEKGTFMTEPMSRFFHTLIRTMTDAGVMRFGTLYLEAKILAMVLCFDYNGVVYLYNSAFDPGLSDLSPGLLSKVFYIKDAIEQDRKIFDFLKGGEIYKYRMGGRETPIYRVKFGVK